MRLRSVILAGLLAGLAPGFSAATDGAVDTSFGTNGLALAAISNSATIVGPIVQPDGKILICATQDVPVSGHRFFVLRFTASGTPDPNFHFQQFDFGGTPQDQCSGLALQSDGKIVVSGFGYKVARLNSDGTLDSANFGAGTGKTTIAFTGLDGSSNTSVAVDSQNRIVVAGTVFGGAHGADFGIARLLSDGSPDVFFNLTGNTVAGFDIAGDLYDVAHRVALDTSDNILVCGSAQIATGVNAYAVLRLTQYGQPDSQFGSNGRATVYFNLGGNIGDNAISVLPDRDGNIVLVGTSSIAGIPNSTGVSAARLLSNGTLDTSFAGGGKFSQDLKFTDPSSAAFNGIAQQSNGTLLLAGNFQADASGHRDAVALRLDRGGTLDTQFKGGVDSFAFGLTTPDDQIFVGTALQGTRIIMAGEVYATDGSGAVFAILVRLSNDLLFADGF